MESDIENLKKVYVLARVLKVTDNEFKSQIAIYNNTQNPITTRDMASNREEQLQLYNGLLDGIAPNIYMEIRRGMSAPSDVRLYKHQYTTNVELAQLAYAGFVRDPFIAKDKKNAIFDTDYKQTEGYLLNEYYHKLFKYGTDDSQKGILFRKTKEEINEILFVHYLYRMSKKNLIAEYKKRINDTQEQLENCEDDDRKKVLEKKIMSYERLKAIANVCVFYCIAYYYGFKETFHNMDSDVVFRYEEFYSDREFQTTVVNSFRDLFLIGTIETIKEVSAASPNLNTWIRDKKSTAIFLEKSEEKLQMDMNLETKYREFVREFKH